MQYFQTVGRCPAFGNTAWDGSFFFLKKYGVEAVSPESYHNSNRNSSDDAGRMRNSVRGPSRLPITLSAWVL